MDPGGGAGAFGGSMAGSGAQDPLTFVKKPTVMLRIACLVRKRKESRDSSSSSVLYSAAESSSYDSRRSTR